MPRYAVAALQWRHNGRDDVPNKQPHDCILNRLFRHRPKKTLKLCVTDLCEGNSPVIGEFPAQRASNAEIFPFDDVIMGWKIVANNHACMHYTYCRIAALITDGTAMKSMQAKCAYDIYIYIYVFCTVSIKFKSLWWKALLVYDCAV